MNILETEKRRAAEKAIEFIKSGMTIGCGTGSTVYYAIQKIGTMVQDGLNIKCVPSSKNTLALLKKHRVPVKTINQAEQIDITIDGADRVDRNLNLIKGGGGALLREKIIASISSKLIIIVDSSKIVDILGGVPLPVEVMKICHRSVYRKLEQSGLSPSYRETGGRFFVTDNGNYIIDLHIPMIENPDGFERDLNLIPGVIDNGLFIRMTDTVICGNKIYKQKIHL